LEAAAEEMVECYCNGEFAGVSFWNPHRFRIGKWLHPGKNELTLVVTGNIANRYGMLGKNKDFAGIPYGMVGQDKD
jgi:hypothetical protein